MESSYFWLVLGSLALVQLLHTFGCIEQERIGLLKLKEEIFKLSKFDSAFEFSTWGEQETNCCKWNNVKCDLLTKRVVQLDLIIYNQEIYNQEIDAKRGLWYLNSSLLLPFQELHNFSIDSDNVKGFHGVLNLSKLKMLILYLDPLTDIPSIGNGTLNSLKSLRIAGNFSNFQELIKLKSLDVLDMTHNQYSGQFPSVIWRMTSLKSLSFRGCDITGSLQGLCRLRNLVELDLSWNRLSGVIPSCLGSLTSLKVLDLSRNDFVGKIPQTIFQNLKLLEYVSLYGNQLEGSFTFSSLSANSRLEVFLLQLEDSLGVTITNKLKVDTENPPNWAPLFQLKELGLAHCRLTGTIPNFLENQYELKYVDLSHNNLVGQFPTWLLVNMTNLQSLSLRNNSLFSLRLPLDTKLNLTNLEKFDVSMNQIHGELPNFIGMLSGLRDLNLSMNYLQGNIPASIGDMKFLEMLDLSNNNLSGVIPQHLAMGCVSLTYLKLSSNALQGSLLSKKSNLTSLKYLYLDNNQFSGGLFSQRFLNSTRRNSISILKINDNLITGEIPADWLGEFSFMHSLVLSRNSFHGLVPASLCRLKNLNFLDLSWNHFHGMIPSCMNRSYVRYMHLQGNKFSGTIPHALSGLSSASRLITLDVRANELSGKINPDLISSLSSLRILLLKGNNLQGLIPSQICHLKNLTILDLSSNNFTGRIPTCLYQIPFGSKRLNDDTFHTDSISYGFGIDHSLEYRNEIDFMSIVYSTTDVEEEIEFMSKSRSESYKGDILYYMSGIDLSQNKLTGPIPNELGNLTGIHTLNLSHNDLTGLIPTSLSNMKEIESLDLSCNKLSGQIPQELTRLTFLSIFSVAFNDLSGKIPNMQAQFGTFEKSSYEGNPLLCGPPLENSCFTPGRLQPASITPEPEDPFRNAFFRGFLVSYFAAFSGVISFLYYIGFFSSRHWPFKSNLRN